MSIFENVYNYVGAKERSSHFCVVFYTVNKHKTHYAYCTKHFSDIEKAFRWAGRYRLKSQLSAIVVEFEIDKNGLLRRL